MILSSVFIFILGTLVGSFLNVVILRSGAGFLTGRSECFSCGKPLTSGELIPIFSFLYLKGRCSKCKSKISWQYPLVEFITGFLFLCVYLSNATLLFVNFNYFVISLFLDLVLSSLFVVIFFYDAKHKIIPDIPAYSIICLSFIKMIFFDFSIFNAISGPILFLFFFSIWFLSRGRAMGFGDAKLALGIGWFLPFFYAVSAIMLSFWIGALYGLSVLLLNKIGSLNLGDKKLTIKSEIPFAPFLIIGAFIGYFFQIDLLGLSLFFK